MTSSVSIVGETVEFIIRSIDDFDTPVIRSTCLTERFFSYMIFDNNISMRSIISSLAAKYVFLVR